MPRKWLIIWDRREWEKKRELWCCTNKQVVAGGVSNIFSKKLSIVFYFECFSILICVFIIYIDICGHSFNLLKNSKVCPHGYLCQRRTKYLDLYILFFINTRLWQMKLMSIYIYLRWSNGCLRHNEKEQDHDEELEFRGSDAVSMFTCGESMLFFLLISMIIQKLPSCLKDWRNGWNEVKG